MPRSVDPKRTRKALRQVRRLKSIVNPDGTTPDYSQWEEEFLAEVENRLDAYGSAFADLSKDRPDDALSMLQAVKIKEIARKAKGKTAFGMRRRPPGSKQD
jgi:hypothetical protein